MKPVTLIKLCLIETYEHMSDIKIHQN